MKTMVKLALVVLLVLVATNVRGALIEFGIDYYADPVYGVTLQLQSSPRSVLATAFAATWRAGDTLPAKYSSPFVTFCLDLNNPLVGGWWQSGDFSDPVLTEQSSPAIRQPNSLYRAANLYNHFSSGIMNPDGTWVNKLDGAALQLSIWEVLYETSPEFNIYSGAGFNATTGNLAVLDRANEMLRSNYSAITDDYEGTFWNAVTQNGDSRLTQDLIGPLVHTPEPSLLSLAMAFILLGPVMFNIWRYRRTNV